MLIAAICCFSVIAMLSDQVKTGQKLNDALQPLMF